jgi:hypothetical protein
MSTEEEKAKEETKKLSISEQLDKLKDTPEFAAILNQHGKTYHELKAEESAGSFMGKAYNNVDNALMEELELKERPTGKTTELVRQLAKEKKALESKLAKLANDDTSKDDNAAKEQLHNSQLSALQKQVEELTKAKESLEVQGKHQKATNSLVNGLTGESFDPNLSNSVLTEIKTIRINKAVSNSKEVDGKIIFYMEDGQPYTNLNGLPMSAKEVGKELFKDIFYSKTAGGNANTEDKPLVKGDIVVLPNPQQISSFAQFNAEFAKAVAPKGWASHEERYIKLQQATIKHYKLDKLPIE